MTQQVTTTHKSTQIHKRYTTLAQALHPTYTKITQARHNKYTIITHTMHNNDKTNAHESDKYCTQMTHKLSNNFTTIAQQLQINARNDTTMAHTHTHGKIHVQHCNINELNMAQKLHKEKTQIAQTWHNNVRHNSHRLYRNDTQIHNNDTQMTQT